MTTFADQTGEWENRKISVIGTLASFINQLTIGDDLTKISIPSALLCPYSALELAAVRALRYFDLMLKANKIEDPLQRFLAIVKWYLAYNPKEKLGKKPFNPILAETHLAWLNHADTEFKGETTFFAEQVSHHPPVTAYVIENKEEGVKIKSNALFKTYFHGNSVTAAPTGSTYVHFTKYDEVYELPKGLPDMGVKNVILGTRRHAWEGEIQIICKKTGYKAVLTYAEEGWWCINTVNGYIAKMEGNTETKLFTITGPLGENITIAKPLPPGSMYYPVQEPFIDLAKIVPLKINYIPFAKLEERCSVRLWRELSVAIVADDMVAADVAKRVVEDAQRKRRADNTSYTPSFFAQSEETKFWELIQEKWPSLLQQIATANDPLPEPPKEEEKKEEKVEEKKEEEKKLEEEQKSDIQVEEIGNTLVDVKL